MRLTITLDAAYPGIVQHAREAMLVCRGRGAASVVPVVGSAAVKVISYSKDWAALFPQHGPGHKHDRSIVLLPWQASVTAKNAEEFVRGLIHSDGSRYIAKQRAGGKIYEYARYCFANYSDDIREILTHHLNLLGVEWTRSNSVQIQIARRASVQTLDGFIGPKA